MSQITKHIFLESRQCLTRGWFLRNHGPARSPSDADVFRMEQGQGIGQLACLLYPDGVLVEEQRVTEAAKRTTVLLADPMIRVIFEATFLVGGCSAKADILARGQDGWIVNEVKSALEDTEQFSDLVDDVTYTAMVAQASGLKVEKCCLLLVSRGYRHGIPPQDLFAKKDVTEHVQVRLADFRTDLKRVGMAIQQTRPPEARLIASCRGCEFFRTDCIGQNVEHPITEIPRLHRNRLGQLADQGIVDIPSIPNNFLLSDTQRIAVDCVKSGREFVSPDLRQVLASVRWPAAYLDFETVSTALPLYPGVAPYEQVTTQFSVHVCDEPGRVVVHHEYLADPACDCRRELAEELLEVLDGDGSIIVYYATFERGQMAKLAKLFPDLAPQLEAAIGRLFDLEAVIRRSYYNPEFRGSFSIKRVLPVLVPDLSYDGLPIGDGDTAMSTYARMAMGQYDGDKVAEIRRHLLQYCRLDTLAMVRLHQQLLEIAAIAS